MAAVKVCFKCGQEFPLDRFYKNSMMKDGRMNKCKECTKADVRENRAKKITYYRNFDRARGARRTTSQVREYRMKNPDVYRAHNAVNNAVRDGKLNKKTECERCGGFDRIHGHHDDYSRPLDVMWLCAACHKKRHLELGWGYIWNLGLDMAG